MSIPVQDTDDGMALALALTSPELELLGCTTCAGNCRTAQSTENTLRMLEIAGRADIPVAPGREAPFLWNADPHFQYLEAKTTGPERIYWARMPAVAPPGIHPSSKKAHELIIDAAKTYPDEVTLVCIGTLTNPALALLAAPEIAPLIREIVHMGGTFNPKNATSPPFVWQTPDIPDHVWRSTLRFNTLFDPEASAIVFRSGIPLRFVTVNVTTRVFQTIDDLDRIRRGDTPFHRFIHAAGRPWVEWSSRVRNLPGAHMHDPLALAVVIDRRFCTFEKMHVDTDRFLAGKQPWLRRKPDFPQAAVAVDVDAEKFEKFLAERLSSPVCPAPEDTHGSGDESIF